MSDYTLADYIFDEMEAAGFHYMGFTGRVGEEILTFKNDAGEEQTVKHGFTTAGKKNIKLTLPKPSVSDSIPAVGKHHVDNVPIITRKIDFSDTIKKGGNNGERL